MRAPDDHRPSPVCLEVMATVLAESRKDGCRERIRVIVPCPIREFEALPVVGRFLLARGKEIVRFGLDGRPFGRHEELHDYGSTFRTPAGNFAGPWCTEILGRELPKPAKSEPQLPSTAQAAKGRIGDPALAAAWNLNLDAARIAAIEERAAADFAVCAGELLTVAPFPRWSVSGDGARIELVKASDEILHEENFVAAERLCAAEEIAALRSGERGLATCRGRVVDLDVAYQTDRDEVFLARGVGQFFAERFRIRVQELPSDLVRAWHDVASGTRMRRDGDPAQAVDLIASSFRLMAAFEAHPELSGRTKPHPDPWWQRIRDRIVHVEGLGSQVVPGPLATASGSPRL
ncbi:hypothetical protein BHAOGJBA_1318 [Methylobacterium hispanicum]|uniref:Uncharacterized protein n=2 Tax=Methylobacterium hispanicum TaxID=270350 RepID=A0AAV4ZIT6_9HYPH|nr:hypothetical protein BHAOGJBA_1318 [Methylobacterium hispanicum]